MNVAEERVEASSRVIVVSKLPAGSSIQPHRGVCAGRIDDKAVACAVCDGDGEASVQLNLQPAAHLEIRLCTQAIKLATVIASQCHLATRPGKPSLAAKSSQITAMLTIL